MAVKHNRAPESAEGVAWPQDFQYPEIQPLRLREVHTILRPFHLPRAQQLLAQAYSARRDAEIGAHLGEVLWQMGKQTEAVEVWREVRQREPANEVLQETLKRLKPSL